MPSTEYLHLAAQPSAVDHALAEWLATQMEDTLTHKELFTLAISGGSTPVNFFRLLATPPWQKRFDWSRLALFWVDERVVPPTHPASNFHSAAENLLTHLLRPPAQVWRWHTEYDVPHALADYRYTLDRFAPDGLDAIILGLGPDGHTASLFPYFPELHTSDIVAAPYNPALPQPQRLTLTLPTLNRARHLAMLVTEPQKKEVAAAILTRPASDALPASLIHPVHEPMQWFLTDTFAPILNT
ncbi:MAG: 6-phosphogluconolactonase [Firmicutes bacterium]|nr:6-phosphogluconolactonase [Bacillota bacterium]